MRSLSAFLVILICGAMPLLAKRGPDPKVEPIHHNGVVYTACPQPSKMGLVEAWSEETCEKLWEKRIYHVYMVPLIEQDTQWVFINKMTLVGDVLHITNERGDSFTLDLKTKEVEKVKKTKAE